MRLVTYSAGGRTRAGMIGNGNVIDLGYGDIVSFLADGERARERAMQLSESSDAATVLPLHAVQIHAPIPRPPKFLLIGLNYRDHAIESGMKIPDVPTVFAKYSNAVIGPGEAIELPAISQQVDYEAELAFVIGKRGRNIPADRWREYVFGYTIVNDVSARDVQMATSQWTMGKTFDTFGPMGPELVSADEIADPHNLRISCEVNGRVLQDSSTSQLIFRIPDLVAYISQVLTFEPGDVVSTGTPPGVGFARKPPVFLQAGDEVVVKVEGLGELRNPVR
ncbi:MAG TPA: fumarylacetoacetate hydrolase family protein [Bryobacterales bacterium]|jgi:2-keto-4-pentenoate hydratase/2-oxohepta-3-ene-1,7-dioic acid hydratase in catechol pathway|nr:fumarylacetoacetate hydrolase family protein [Bryobacterales bacterium]